MESDEARRIGLPLNVVRYDVGARSAGNRFMAATDQADRLDSWKEIASFLRRDVRTAQRWERRESMPVHRHHHDKLGSVYASRSELSEWLTARQPATGASGQGSEDGRIKLAV